ncbi:hypothetical protein CROQUDRAFT_37029, partial [Cronartium quercuum f. sp. fusiforme G11]
KKCNMLVFHAVATFVCTLVHLLVPIWQLKYLTDQSFLMFLCNTDWWIITQLGLDGPFVVLGNMRANVLKVLNDNESN